MAIVERAGEMGLDVRAGLHSGECELSEGDVRGVASQIAARVLASAAPGEVVVSSTITDLVAGSGIAFEPLGRRLTAGGGRRLELFRVVSDAPHSTRAVGAFSAVSIDDTKLSPREIEIATLIGRGLSNRQIAEHLSISIATVERHVANIFNKLGLHARAQVAVWAAEHGLPVRGTS